MKISLLRRSWAYLAASVFGFYAARINRLRVEGGEHLPPAGGVLLAANHISGFETVFLPWAVMRFCPWQMVWAPAKEELFRNPLLGWLLRSWGAFPVRRGRDVRAGRELGRLLQSEKVMLFPEGTRHRDGQLGKGNRGVGKLIYDHRSQVIPVAIIGLNHWKVFAWRQPACIRFGPPLDFSDLLQQEDGRATQVAITERLMAAIAELLAEGERPT